ncbi:MAG TPA: cytochrome P450 [Acidimicrobiia bacterium]|nr:cytochrome P450 [Acidimicrobiia bacterium]
MFDPFDAAQSRDAWTLLRELREAGPLATVAGGLRYITRHAEARAVLRDTETFSNASGLKAPGVVIPLEDRLLGELDPPRHTAVRRVMVTAMTPKVVHAAEPFIAATADALLEALPADRFDLVAAYTGVLPNHVTVYLLGFDPADSEQLARWAKELMESTFPALNRTDRGVGFAAAFPDFAGYIDARIAERTAQLDAGETRDDVLARLIRLEVDEAPLPPEQLRALVRNLITGGLTTTSQLLGNLLFEIVAHPELEAEIRGDRTRLATAIEESLRLTPPVLFMARGCVRETEIGGCPVQPGERVAVGAASANRDERVFENADEFRADRANADQHLTFGYGSHVCPGATLARAIARIGVGAVLDRFEPGTLRLEPGFVFEQVPTFFEHGPRRLPVVVGDRAD